MKAILLGCQLGSAVTALLAAWFWFRSARERAPPMTYEGIERLQSWLDGAVSANRWAASFAAASALLAGIGTLIGLM
jgi:hypothetical protein